MSLERILQSMEAAAAQEIQAIQAAAQSEIEQIRTRAQEDADAVRRQTLDAARTRAQTERSRRLNRAKRQAHQIRMQARAEWIERAVQAAAERLNHLHTDEQYRAILTRLTEEAVAALRANDALADDSVQIHVAAEDCEQAQNIVQEMGMQAEVVADLGQTSMRWDCRGGVVVSTGGGRIRLTNTLDIRLQRAAERHRTQIAQMLIPGAESAANSVLDPAQDDTGQ